MQTVFSHIIQKRFSHVNEDVATDALAFILSSSEAARNGMMKLLRGVVPELPPLHFHTQQTEGSIRPDVWGFAGTEPRAYVENKFWAGLTDNQPVFYIEQLAEYVQPTLLLVIGPATREHTLWRELSRRLGDAGISVSTKDAGPSVFRAVRTDVGPVLALTSWTSLLSTLERETAEDHSVRSDLIQLRALCDAANNQAFVPISPSQLSDQCTPAFILRLGDIAQASVNLAVTEGILNITRLLPQASWDRIGRYMRFSSGEGVGAWLGIRFDLWREHGGSPLWLVFTPGDFGRAQEVRPLLAAWITECDVVSAIGDQEVAVAIDLPAGQEKEGVIRSVVNRLKEIADILAELPPRSAQ